MLVLALDTTTAAGSVALADGERLLEVAAIDPLQPVATRVPGDLIALLMRHRITLREIGMFAVATGPGSFTGLRIGIAAMQGLAFANAKPLIGVSSFEALATMVDAPHVAVWIDAWRGEVYAATYARSGAADSHLSALQELDEPIVAPPADLLSRRATSGDLADMVFIGDGAVKYREFIPSARIVQPTPLVAGVVARRAAVRAQHGDAPPPHAIRPLYVRRPDAELARERRPSG